MKTRKKRWHRVTRIKLDVLTLDIAHALRDCDTYERTRVLRAASLLVGDNRLEQIIRRGVEA